MAYRLAAALAVLRNEVNRRWPARDKASDGWIGDAAHATRQSDHTPWIKDSAGVGVVRALDIDAGEGTNHEIGLWIAEHVRALGAAGFAPLQNGGYVISNWRIASATGRWAWRRYEGRNGHTSHTHISVSTVQAQYDSRASWNVVTPAVRVLHLTEPRMRGDDVRDVQRVLAAWYPSLGLAADGVYGPATEAAVRHLQERAGLEVDGIVGPATRAVLGIRP